MYKVFCDEWQIYNMTMPSLKLVNPKADLEVNKAGSFTFTIYPQHPYYDKLQKMKSIILIYQNDRVIFRGRILNSSKGFYNQKQVTCEGELAFFVDSTIRPYDFQGDVPEYFAFLIGEHNKQVKASKQFKVGNVTVTDPNGYITRSDSTYPTTYDCITSKLVNSLGGYIQFRHETDGVYVDYLADFTTLNSQDIELKKNILDISEDEKGEGIATAIIPLGAKIEEEGVDAEEQKRLTIESVNDGKDYVYNPEAVEKYGWIYKTVTWDDVTLPENLLRKANEELSGAILFENTIEVNAVDLSGTNKEISSFSVGSYNNVKSKQHGIERMMLVKKLSLNLNAPQNDTMTLGDTRKTFTEQDKENSDKIGEVIEKTEIVISDYLINKPVINQQIQTVREELISSIEQEATDIRTEVSENYYLKDDAETLNQSVGTQLEQTKDEFNFTFNEFRQNIDDLEAGTNAEFEEIKKYIRFVDGKILLGIVGNELELQLANDRISFFQNGSEVAYFTNNRFYVKDGEFTNSLTLGNFAFIPRSNGNLSFKKVR